MNELLNHLYSHECSFFKANVKLLVCDISQRWNHKFFKNCKLILIKTYNVCSNMENPKIQQRANFIVYMKKSFVQSPRIGLMARRTTIWEIFWVKIFHFNIADSFSQDVKFVQWLFQFANSRKKLVKQILLHKIWIMRPCGCDIRISIFINYFFLWVSHLK